MNDRPAKSREERWEEMKRIVRQCYVEDIRVPVELVKWKPAHPAMPKDLQELIAYTDPYFKSEVIGAGNCVRMQLLSSYILTHSQVVESPLDELIQTNMESALLAAIGIAKMAELVEDVEPGPAYDIANILVPNLLRGIPPEDVQRYKNKHKNKIKRVNVDKGLIIVEFRDYILRQVRVQAVKEDEDDEDDFPMLEDFVYEGGVFEFFLNICFRSPKTARVFVATLKEYSWLNRPDI